MTDRDTSNRIVRDDGDPAEDAVVAGCVVVLGVIGWACALSASVSMTNVGSHGIVRDTALVTFDAVVVAPALVGGYVAVVALDLALLYLIVVAAARACRAVYRAAVGIPVVLRQRRAGRLGRRGTDAPRVIRKDRS